jgi:large subunit ribosomal protein L19
LGFEKIYKVIVMSVTIEQINQENLKTDIPEFKSGDTITVNVRIQEGGKTRIQAYKGVVIQRRNSGIAETVTVRKISGQISVERIFPLHSPIVDSIEVERHGKVRRARIFYMRDLRGKAARIKEVRK